MENLLHNDEQNLTLIYPKAIIFDWDNTLVESHEVITRAVNSLFKDFGLAAVTVEQIKEAPQRALKDSFPEMFGDRWQEARDIYHRYYREIHLDYLTPHQGAEALLNYLTNIGMPLFIVSNKTHDHLEAEIKALQWDAHFHFIRGSIDGRVDKPDPEAVHQALENSGIFPSQDVWFVGDSPIDAECAVAAGCLPIILQEKKNILNFKYFEKPLVFIDNLLEVKVLLAKAK